LTLRGLSALRSADRILVPVRDDVDEVGYAERVVRHHLADADVVRAPFALTDRGGRTERRVRAWDVATKLVTEVFASGDRRVCFATIGDPNVYSTFGYLATAVSAAVPAVRIETVPGITAMQALAAASGTVLCEGSEPLILLPVREEGALLDTMLADPLLSDAAVVAYKGGRHWPRLREVLARHGRLDGAVVGTHLGRPDQIVRPALRVTEQLPYLSTVLAVPARPEHGGKL
jgi:precorrin-2/cobalt-factor-2 C20-methyltransferase